MTDKQPIDAQDTPQRFETIAGFVEASLFDPDIMPIIDSAMLYDEYLRQFPVEPERRTKIINELDASWRPWMKAAITVTGTLKLFLAGELSEPITVSDARGISNGFNITTFSEDEEGESNPKLRLGRMQYDFYVLGQYLGEEYNDETLYRALAVIDEALLQTDVPSTERAIKWLQASSPYFIEEVDRRITQTRTPEEALLALKGLEIDASVEVTDDLTRNSAAVYLNSMIQLDQVLPYDIRVSGVTYDEKQDETYAIYRKLHAIGQLGKIGIAQKIGADGSAKWEVSVPTTLHLADVATDTIECDIPIDSIVSIESIRRARLASGKTSTGE